MSATVVAADGTDVILSPTGVAALERLWLDYCSGGRTFTSAIHPATREKLLGAGLIEPHGSAMVQPTRAGLAAARLVAAS